MLLDLVDTLQTKRRLLLTALFGICALWMILFGNQLLQANRSDITARIQTYETTKTLVSYQSEVTNGDLVAQLDHSIDALEIGFLRATISTTDWIAKAEEATQRAIAATVQALGKALIAIVRFIGVVLLAIIRLIGQTLFILWKIITFPFVLLGKGAQHAFGAVSGATNGSLASVIQPHSDSDVPVITPEQAQQVSIIQENTLRVEPIRPIGSGGACDNGSGNGGYPMEWCDARMDTIRTVSYSSDRINRQCTSYAYWYFTAVKGHTDFHVTGNAKFWATTSNYPTHATPAVGAIAVSTRGYYGHVAIVQALAGQTYDGKVVPEGYVLVSEMNYDWQGHFRYSYSPVNKFSAYIYR